MDPQGRVFVVGIATVLAAVTACGAAGQEPAATATAMPTATGPITTPTIPIPTGPPESPTPTPLAAPTSTPIINTPAPLPSAVTVYRLSASQTSSVTYLRTGPDGALWFTLQNASPDELGRITTDGVVTFWPVPFPGAIQDFAFGGGSLWSVDFHSSGQSFIGEWDLTGTLLREFPIPGTAHAITWGPDGALWFSGAAGSGMALSGSFIGRMTVQGVVTRYPLPDGSDLAGSLIPGPDGAIWFSELPGANVGRITTSGAITEFNVPSTVNVAGPISYNQTITTGPDGSMWAISNDDVARVTTTGAVTALPYNEPGSIAVNPDGDLWVIVGDLLGGTHAVLRVTTSGSTIADYPVNAIEGSPTVITTGPDGMIWFGDQDAIARLDPSVPPNT